MASKDLLYRIIGDASQGISEFEKFAKKAQDLTHVGRAGMIMGGLIAAGVGVAVAKYAEFDAAMSNVVATGEDAAASQDELRQAAMDAGASTVFSATESANAIEELAKAGVSAEDTLAGGLTGALDLAAAGGLGVADAATIMATSMNQFAVDGRDATHVADLLAAGAGKAQGDVTDMSQALAQAGLVANSTGLSIEETTGGLAAFASAGMLGSDAGTSFKSMLQRLTPQSSAAKAEMDRLGISAYDASGNFIGLADFAGNLQDKLRSLTPEQRNAAMATIFGSDAVRAATILYDQGADGIQKWTDAVNDQGYAAQVARQRLDNLQGDVEALGGAFDSALIASGSGANDGLRALTQTATGAVSAFADLPEPIQEAGIYLAASAAAVALLGGASLVAIPKLSALRTVVTENGGSFRRMSFAAGGAVVGLTAVIAIVSEVASAQAEAQARTEAYVDTLESGTLRVTKATREMTKENLSARQSVLFWEQSSAYENAEKLGISLELVTDAASGNVDALREFNSATDISNMGMAEREALARRLGISYVDLDVATGQLRDSVRGESSSIEEAIATARRKQEADKDSVESSKSSAEAYLETTEQVADLSSEVDKLVDSLNKANGVGQDAVSANISYQDALAKVDEQIQKAKEGQEGYALTLDTGTQAGRDNLGMLNDMAARSQAAAEAQFALDGNTEKYRQSLESGRQTLIDRIADITGNREAAEGLADQIYRIPSQTEWKLIAETGEAAGRIASLQSAIDGLRGKTIGVNAVVNLTTPNGKPVTDPQIADQLGFGSHADGGEVHGPGTGTSDSILAWISNGEFIVREAVARDHLAELEYLNTYGSMPKYKDGGVAGLAAASPVSRVPMLALASSGGSRAAMEPLAPAMSVESTRVDRGGDRPIYADGIGLIGWVREIAGQEAQLVWASAEGSNRTTSKMGKQRYR